MSQAPRSVTLPCGEPWPAIGLGTWRMGESARTKRREVQAVEHALALGYRLIDTAEMYGEGGAEEVVGHALAAALRGGLVRDAVRIVSKVYPQNASRSGVVAACERSRRRLGVDQIDLYLLHWRGSVPLQETVSGFEELRRRGWIRHWGVSNFDVADMAELHAVADGAHCQSNQVYYSLASRGLEFDLLPWSREHAMPLMAYSPIDQGSLARHAELSRLAGDRGWTPAQLALAWAIRSGAVMAIPKAVQPAHLQANFDAGAIELGAEDLAALDRLFPPPTRKQALAMT